jgi:hypothetical protein
MDYFNRGNFHNSTTWWGRMTMEINTYFVLCFMKLIAGVHSFILKWRHLVGFQVYIYFAVEDGSLCISSICIFFSWRKFTLKCRLICIYMVRGCHPVATLSITSSLSWESLYFLLFHRCFSVWGTYKSTGVSIIKCLNVKLLKCLSRLIQNRRWNMTGF